MAPVIWKGLAEEWRLSPEEWRLVDEQQGGHCRRCGTNLRSQALAAAMMKVTGFQGLFLQYGEWMAARGLQVLEINLAAEDHLHPLARRPADHVLRERARPGHRLATYPDVDMMAMPYAGGSFDLVIHSDTLEHVRHPVRALAECRRVLKPGCYFVVEYIDINTPEGWELFETSCRAGDGGCYTYHTPEVLARVFRAAGLEVIEDDHVAQWCPGYQYRFLTGRRST